MYNYTYIDKEKVMLNQKALAQLLMRLGCEFSYKGFKYLQDIVTLICEHEEKIGNLCAHVYPDVAEKYGVSIPSIEHDLRTVIKNSWKEQFEEVQKISPKKLKYPPTIKEYLAILLCYFNYDDTEKEQSY